MKRRAKSIAGYDFPTLWTKLSHYKLKLKPLPIVHLLLREGSKFL